MPAIATHPSAEPNTLIVRYEIDAREWLLADAPDIYYVTDYYVKYPVVLVRLGRVDRAAVHDLLSVSKRLTMAKTRRPKARKISRRFEGV